MKEFYNKVKTCFLHGPALLLTAVIFLLLFSVKSFGQNTVGTVLYTDGVQEGYTLFTLHKQTFLIDNCGQVINQWTSEYTPGNAVYLLEDGSLLRAGNTLSTDIAFGGSGGIIERFNWEGDIIWSFLYDTPEHRQHHDIYPMPNGNVLILAAEVIDGETAIALGRDPSKIVEDQIYNEELVEIEPVGTNQGNIVWEWNFFDHIIQDFDATKANFGVVADNPQLVDFNFLNGFPPAFRWLHLNSAQYDEERDQIILSSRFLSEFYIIDHSTTTSEAQSSSGGIYGKGGDFLYRWGNPQAYDQGDESDQQLIGQHYPHFIPNGLADAGKLIVFNNRAGSSPQESQVNLLQVPQTALGFYDYTSGTSYGPSAPSYTFSESDFYSAIVSSAQRLPNNNTIICEGRTGEIFEIDSNDNTVWKYIVPIDTSDGTILSQGDDPESINNLTFRAEKYTPDYAAFIGRDLTPGDPIETNPSQGSCLTLSNGDELTSSISIYPNPTTGKVTINTQLLVKNILLFDLNGKAFEINYNQNSLDLSGFATGIYVVKIDTGNKSIIKRLVKN